VDRTTASVQHSGNLGGKNRWISSTLVWGLNDAGEHHKEHSVLAESNLQLDKWAIYGRYEWIQKNGKELGLIAYDPDPLLKRLPISMFSLGLNRQIVSFSNTLLQAGAQVSLYRPDRLLESIYGKTPLSGQVYLRITPALMRM
jgi:hypothetical protein